MRLPITINTIKVTINDYWYQIDHPERPIRTLLGLQKIDHQSMDGHNNINDNNNRLLQNKYE